MCVAIDEAARVCGIKAKRVKPIVNHFQRAQGGARRRDLVFLQSDYPTDYDTQPALDQCTPMAADSLSPLHAHTLIFVLIQALPSLSMLPQRPTRVSLFLSLSFFLSLSLCLHLSLSDVRHFPDVRAGHLADNVLLQDLFGLAGISADLLAFGADRGTGRGI